MFNAETLRAAARSAKELGVPVNHLLAVAEVESAGKVYAKVAGRDEPLIRFEGHYFDKRIAPHKRGEARKAGLANPKAGGVKNPASQAARWALVERAAALDKQAAYESTSWGLGQVMGSHWKALGYVSVLALVDHARQGAGGQIALMARFIKAHPALLRALAAGQWATFAKGYNGPGYKANAYDAKMAAAAKRWAGVAIPSDAPGNPPAAPVDAQEPPKAPIQPKAPQPAPATPAGAKAAKTGMFVSVIAGLSAMIYAGACHLPGWFINLLGYAAKCGGN